jgi:O-acetyl-ADP-ribose deacetylase (regulator of RNase III)
VKIILAAVEDDLADAWERHCGDLPNVTIHRGSILELSVDAVISPANSFGFMDGGIDHLYSDHFGWEVQERLQEMIRTRHHGELLVGTAEIVDTGHLRIPYVIVAPTMRVPMVLTETINPYLAARAALLLIRNGVIPSGALMGEAVATAVQSVAFPGLGTGIGRVGPNTCAHQVRAAIEEVLLGLGQYPKTWAEAQRRHQLLYTDQVRDLQKD